MACSYLWTRVDQEMAVEILTETQASHKTLYRLTLRMLAPHMKVRPAKLLEMPKVERHKRCSQLLAHPEFEPLSLNLFTQWLRGTHLDLILFWLDYLQIKHDATGCFRTAPPCPDPDTLKKGIDQMLERYSPAVVLIYLSVFNEAIETQWPALWEILLSDIRFPLTPMPEA